MPKRCQEEPKGFQKFIHVHFKADFIETNSTYEEEPREFIFPSTVSDIGSSFPAPSNTHKTAYNPSCCSEERLTLKMSDFLSYGDNFTFEACLISNFRVSLAQPRGTKVFHQNKPSIAMTLCLIWKI